MHHLLGQTASTLATAESLTGGRLASMLTAVPGASATYRGGVVGYATDVKVGVLGVPPDLVERYGVVSAECAAAMAQGALALTGATYAVATTGVAGPTEQEGKPAGTVFIAVAGPAGVTAVALELAGSREQIVERTCTEALTALLAVLDGDDDRATSAR